MKGRAIRLTRRAIRLTRRAIRITQTEQEREDAMISGVLMALAVVYNSDPDPTATLACEIVKVFNTSALLRVAKKEEDYILPKLQKTIAYLRQ